MYRHPFVTIGKYIYQLLSLLIFVPIYTASYPVSVVHVLSVTLHLDVDSPCHAAGIAVNIINVS